MIAPSVLVVGGGLAGIAAAVRASEAGCRVTVIEARNRLGGRASSFDDEGGMLVDACQHVVLRCCRNMIDLLERLGTLEHIEWFDTIWFIDRMRRRTRLCASPLPPPLHLMGAVRGSSWLSLADQCNLARALTALLVLGRTGRESCASITFADWLHRHGQTAKVIDRFWNLLGVSALNETAARASAAHACQFFQESLLARADAGQLGIAKVPLADLYQPLPALLERRGGSVLLANPATALEFDGAHITGVRLRNDAVMRADQYVIAVPFDRLERLLPSALRQHDPRFAHLGELSYSPILGIHLWLRAKVVDLPQVALLESPMQWLFAKAGREGGQHLVLVVSAARDWIDRSQEEILQLAIGEIEHHFPGARAVLTRGRVIKDRTATFSPVPGVDTLRPLTSGAVANLMLAGDWVQCGWPATMEGAVRSGYQAIEAITQTTLRVAEQEPAGLLRWLPQW